jgi:hypothetical protein
MNEDAPERDWRLHPFVRVLAAGITIVTIAVFITALSETPSAFAARDWRSIGFCLLMLGLLSLWGLTYGRLIAIAAWTGEEPTIDVDDDDDAGADPPQLNDIR